MKSNATFFENNTETKFIFLELNLQPLNLRHKSVDPWSATDQKSCKDPQCSHWELREEKVGTFWIPNQWFLSSRWQQTNLISENPNLTRIQSLPIQSQSVFYLAAFLLWALWIYKSQICKINEASNYTPFSSFMSVAPYTKRCLGSSFLDIFSLYNYILHIS